MGHTQMDTVSQSEKVDGLSDSAHSVFSGSLFTNLMSFWLFFVFFVGLHFFLAIFTSLIVVILVYFYLHFFFVCIQFCIFFLVIFMCTILRLVFFDLF